MRRYRVICEACGWAGYREHWTAKPCPHCDKIDYLKYRLSIRRFW